MKYLKILLIFTVLLVISCNNQRKTKKSNKQKEITEYIDFLQGIKTNSTNYVLSLFDEHDIVILSERAHYEYTQYETYLNIISDDRFINKVGNVFVEVGVSSEQNNVNKFLQAENLTEKEIKQKALQIYRNIPFLASWDKTSYYDFLIKLYKINQNLSFSKKINLFYSDVPFAWENVKSRTEYKEFMNTIGTRDSIIAMQIIENYEIIKKTEKRKKALIILNYRHGFTNIRYTKHGAKAENAGRYLKEKYKNEVVSVLVNDLISENDTFRPYHNGKWDASFELLNKMNIGFNFENSPFGKDSFDMYPVENNLLYKDVFKGFIYTSPIDSFVFKKGVINYIENDFKEEYLRRLEIAGYQRNVGTDTIQRTWKYNEKRWCPNYDIVKAYIYQWKK